MDKLMSRKLIVTVAHTILLVIVKALGVEIDDATLMQISAGVVAYVLGQSYVDSKKETPNA